MNMAGNFSIFIKRRTNGNFGFFAGKPAPPPQPPVITVQPTDQTAKEGESVTFTSDGENYDSIQWQVSLKGTEPWKDIAGETDKTLHFDSADIDWNGNKYRVAYTNSVATVYSDEVVLTVIGNPDFKIKPAEIDTDYYGVTYNLGSYGTKGEITPPTDQWVPSGSIQLLAARIQSSSRNDFFFVSDNSTKWHDYERINLKAIAEDETLEISLLFNSLNRRYDTSGAEVAPWVDFLKSHIGKEILIYISEATTTRDKPKPPPILRK